MLRPLPAMRILLVSLALLLCSANSPAQLVVRIPITEGEKQKLDQFLAGRNLLAISNYSPALDSIGPIEQLIFRKAVLLGGLNAAFEDLLVPNSSRARQELRQGRVPAAGTAQWHRYYEEDPAGIMESDVVIPRGSYEKGLYTTREKASRLSIASVRDLKAYSVVSSSSWETDWTTLQRLPFKALYSGATRLVQFRMVDGKRADLSLQDFSANPELDIEEQGVRLYPVRGVKVALDGSRHFFVSATHPDGPRIFEALQRGLRLMQQSGEIRRILLETGFTNPAVKDWTLLNK